MAESESPISDHFAATSFSSPVLRSVGALLAIGFLAYVVVLIGSRADELASIVSETSLVGVLVATTPILLAFTLLAMLGRIVLATHQAKVLDLRRLWVILYASALARYVPGGIWHIGSQFELARRAGVDPRNAFMLWADSMVLSVAANAAVVGIAYMWVSGTFGLPWILVLGGSALVLSLSHPTVRFRVMRWVRLIPTDRSVSNGARSWMIALALAGTASLLLGVSGLMLIRALGVEEGVPFTGVIVLFSGSWLAGFLVFFVPGGLGVREAAFLFLASNWMPPPEALALAVASRLVLLIADLLAGAVAGGLLVYLLRTERWSA